MYWAAEGDLAHQNPAHPRQKTWGRLQLNRRDMATVFALSHLRILDLVKYNYGCEWTQHSVAVLFAIRERLPDLGMPGCHLPPVVSVSDSESSMASDEN